MPHLDRRSLAKATAWSVPVVVAASAAPAYAASATDVGAYQLRGTCGVLGILPPGFTLTAGPTAPLPAGTTVVISASGIANAGVFTLSPPIGTVTVLGNTSRLVTLTSELPAGATLSMRTTLSISQAFTLNGVTSLPEEYVATGAKSSGSVSSTLVLCSAV